MKKIAVLVIAIFISNINHCFGQNEGIELPNVIGPSPEVAALAKYIEMPVNYSTGIPQIEIPIHTISEGNIQLPVSLSYHAGGIRVNEEASSVGLGWSLMAGGVIGRTIKGKPDDGGGGGYMTNSFTVQHVNSLQPTQLPNYFENVDTQPDIFFFNFMGYSGRFQFVKEHGTGSFKQLKESNITIDFDTDQQNRLVRFVLTTPDGTKYYFGKSKNFSRQAIEQTNSMYHSFPFQLQDNQETTTAWNLLEVENFSGQKISLHYDHLHTEGDAILENQRILHRYPMPTANVGNCECNIGDPNSDFLQISHTLSVNTRTRPRLESITSTYDSIRFQYDLNHPREDLYGSHPLRKIIVFNNKNNVPVSEFELTHDYFSSYSGESQNYDWIPYAAYRTKRLKLVSVQERGLSTNPVEEHPPYFFDYNEEPLPHKFSYAQDFWGYYNGKDYNPHFLPHIMIGNTVLHKTVGSADRSVDPVKSKAASLVKMTYPTGGYTRYEYENNKISTIYQPYEDRRYTIRNRLDKKYEHFTKNTQTQVPNNPNHYQYTFEVGAHVTGEVFFDVYELTGNGCGDPVSNFDCDFMFTIEGVNNSYIHHISNRQFSQKLEPGEYKITAAPYFSMTPTGNETFDILINWEEDPDPYSLTAGGLRVKTIRKYDDNEDLLLKKTFQYTRETTQAENSLSGLNVTPSGNMGWWPQHYFTGYEYTNTPCCVTMPHTLITSYSQKPLFSYNGSSVLYEKVTEHTENVQELFGGNGSFKTEYFFDWVGSVNSPGDPVLDILLDEMYSNPLRGNLIERRNYKKEGGNYAIVSKEINTYESQMNPMLDCGVLVIPNKLFVNTGEICYAPEGLVLACSTPMDNYTPYAQRSITHRPKSTTKIEYYPSGTIEQTTEYFYNSNPVLPSHTETTYTEGGNLRSIETHYQYPFDLLPHTQMQHLVDQNRINQPVKVTKIVDGTPVRTTNTTYSTNSSTSGLTLPTILQADKGNGANLENRIRYDRYDDKGNLLQAAMEKGAKIAYIWGYHGQYPVAKIENITYSAIPPQLITNIKNASDSGTEAQLLTAFNALRNDAALSRAMVTTYTYKPLVGITSITDPKGDSITYHYDAFGRLEYIKDSQGHILEDYEYHYWDGQDHNYVKTTTYKTESGSKIPSPNLWQAQQQIAYYDGLGRPIQHIAKGQSGTGKDLITHIEYDGYGRQVKDYLPYERSGGSSLNFAASAKTDAQSFYNTPYFQNTTNPYSEKQLENSPLSRVLKQAAPGNPWAMGSNHEIKYNYNTNHVNELYYFSVNGGQLQYNGHYIAGELYATIIYDENSLYGYGSVTEYKNQMGQVVAKRIQDDENSFAFTYYVYDDYGNLVYVLPPKLSEQIISGSSLTSNYQQLLDELGYYYVYDHRNRLVQKKLPGKHREYIVYDELDRPVATGPTHSPFEDDNEEGWLHTKYDAFNRVAYTLWNGQHEQLNEESWNTLTELVKYSPRISEEAIPDNDIINGVPVFYTRDVYPNTGQVLTINYYDDYRFHDVDNPGSVLEQEVFYNEEHPPVGLPTGSWVRALQTQQDTNAEITYLLYDYKARPVRTHSLNYLDGYTQADVLYDFSGKILRTETEHLRDSNTQPVLVEEDFTYTAQDRLEMHTHTVNGGTTEILQYNEYDALGQLITKHVGGDDPNYFLQKVDYQYNIRGWLTDINNIANLAETGAPQDLFAFRIYYNSTSGGNTSVVPLYNGNVAETHWRTASDNIRRKYGYSYDDLNRLTDAWYSIPSAPVQGSYNEHLTYDSNGNILSLQRFGEVEEASLMMMIDDLEYDYTSTGSAQVPGNKLINVTDHEAHPAGFDDGNIHTESSMDDFEYDAYGNLTADRNKRIYEITYNHLNLPKKIFSEMGEITYLYNANGVKLKKTVDDYQTATETHTHYMDGFQYTDDHLDFFPHAEGYVNVLEYEQLNYVYTYKDHLGNIRLRYALDPEVGGPAILEEDHYYPFGLKHRGYNSEHEIFERDPQDGVVLVPVTSFLQDRFRRKFGGKELQSEFSLEMYDFGARNYDPALGRWMNIDPLAELMRWNSPYSFAFNNPIYFIDRDGNIPLPKIVNYSDISSPFGVRVHPIKKRKIGHAGVDLVAPSGSVVNAAARGTVAKIGWDPDGYGRYIVIKHAEGYYTLYGHLLKNGASVEEGQTIKNGQRIGFSGNTGGSTGPHLHFEIIKSNSLAGVFNKSNKVNPQSIYDLDVMLHGAAFGPQTKEYYDGIIDEYKPLFLLDKAPEPEPEPRPEVTPLPKPDLTWPDSNPIPFHDPGIAPMPDPGGGTIAPPNPSFLD